MGPGQGSVEEEEQDREGARARRKGAIYYDLIFMQITITVNVNQVKRFIAVIFNKIQ